MNIFVKPTELEKLIAVAIDAAEEIRNPLDELIEKSATDPGAPFEKGNVALLADLKVRDPAQFQRIRVRLVENKVKIGELERLISRHDDTEQVPSNGSPLEFEAIDMWPDTVDGEELFNQLVALILRHMVLPRYAAVAFTLWIMFSHTHDCWSISPRLAFLSPEKRCGKTTALSILLQLVPKPLPASNITVAALFRSIHLAEPTLIIDEADTFLKGNDELRGILNSGHNRNHAYVVRAVGEDHTPAKFSTWAPVAIAMIGDLPDTLNDRSIVVRLKRKLPANQVERLRLDSVAHFEAPRQMICRWAADNRHRLPSWDGSVPEGLHDRAADNWRPLLAIADAIGGKCSSLAREAAVALTGMDDEGSVPVLILQDIASLFETQKKGRLSTAVILNHLSGMEGRPWPEYRNGKPITGTQLAKLLKPFGVQSKTIRFDNDETAKGYSREAFDDAFTRYLSLAPVTPSQVNDINELPGIYAVTSTTVVTAKSEQKPNENGCCDGVTAEVEGEQFNELKQSSYHRDGYKKVSI